MPEAPDERAALEAAWQQHQDDGCDAPIMCFEAAWQARGEYEARRGERLREMLAEALGHLEPLAHHAILGPVGSPREWISEGREMARQVMLNVGRWGVAALAGPAPAPEEQRS